MPDTDQVNTEILQTLSELKERLAALENRPVNNINTDEINAAISEHPDMVAFRAFRDKWRNHE